MIDEQAGDEYWRVVETVWDAIDIYHGVQRYLETYAAADQRAATLFAVHFCQSEVRNGGFDQFFRNPTGVVAPEAADGFRSLGMTDAAELVAGAMELFGPIYPRERTVREALLASLTRGRGEEWDPFEDVDGLFFNALEGNGSRFERLADDYARAGAPDAG